MTPSRLILLVSALCAPWLLGGCAGTPAPQTMVAAPPPPPPATMDTHIKEASQRFNVPEKWIRAVMAQESGGRTHVNGQPIVSKKGAMGLMQVMPATWATLRETYKLGDDPFDPRDNIMAGTAYIREMYDQYGSPGFLAAYNAGPGRYEHHLKTHRPLPGETRHYVAVIAPKIDGVLPEGTATAKSVAMAAAASAPVPAAPPPTPAPAPAQTATPEPPRAAEPVQLAALPEPTPPPAPVRPAEPERVAAAVEPPRPIQTASADIHSDPASGDAAPADAGETAAVRAAAAPRAPQTLGTLGRGAGSGSLVYAERRTNLPPGWFVPVAYSR